MHKRLTTFSREEERELFRRWRHENDRDAYSQLVQSQLAWARNLAAKYAKCKAGAFRFDEIECEANMAVLDAIRRFDFDRECRLTTVVEWAVRSRIGSRDKGGAIKVPRNTDAIADQNRDAYEKAQQCQSIVLYGSDEGSNYNEPSIECDPLHELAAAEQSAADTARVRAAVAQLQDRRQRDILSRRFWRGETLKQVGEALGITRERVRQIETLALEKVRKLLSRTNVQELRMEDQIDDARPLSVLEAIDRVTQPELDAEINKLCRQRDALVEQFVVRIKKLEGLRKAMFGSAKRSKPAPSGGVRGRAPSTEPSEGSANRAVWDEITAGGPGTSKELAERLGWTAARVSTTVCGATPRWFTKDDSGVIRTIEQAVA